MVCFWYCSFLVLIVLLYLISSGDYNVPHLLIWLIMTAISYSICSSIRAVVFFTPTSLHISRCSRGKQRHITIAVRTSHWYLVTVHIRCGSIHSWKILELCRVYVPRCFTACRGVVLIMETSSASLYRFPRGLHCRAHPSTKNCLGDERCEPCARNRHARRSY